MLNKLFLIAIGRSRPTLLHRPRNTLCPLSLSLSDTFEASGEKETLKRHYNEKTKRVGVMCVTLASFASGGGQVLLLFHPKGAERCDSKREGKYLLLLVHASY